MKRLLIALLLPAFGLSALASTSVATVTSALPFILNGHSVSTPGVNSYPVVLGDTIATSDGSAVLLFQDGSTIKLGVNSSVKVVGTDAIPKLILLAGVLDYRLIRGSNLAITNLETEHKTLIAAPIAGGQKVTAETAGSVDKFDTSSLQIPIFGGFASTSKPAWTHMFLVPHAVATGPGPMPPVSSYH